ncbi:MAG: tetratricopeptide repeat protein [bacterium]
MKLTHTAIFLLFILYTFGCGNSYYRKGESYLNAGQYELAIHQLKAAERRNPADWKIKRALGMAYFNNKQINEAIKKLAKAYKSQPKDGRTLIYLGLCFEAKQMFAKSTAIYRYYATLSISDPLRKELQARIRDMYRKELQQQVKKSLVDFEQGQLQPIQPNTVAVLYFRNISQWNELDPLIKGIAEIITNDLEKVRNLRLVERLKLQVLLDELKLSSSDFYDQLETPKIGTLLGASQLISGGIERVNETGLQLNAGVVVTETGQLLGDGAQASGTIKEILNLEKTLVFDLIKDMGIELTKAEQEAIRPLPTKNSLAFIAFSKGLDFEDRNNIDEARAHYEKAIESDPDFEMAKQRLAQVSVKRLSISDMEKLAAFEERLLNTEPTPVNVGSRIGMKFGFAYHEAY